MEGHALLLARHQFQELVGEWRVLGQVLPRMEAERVGQPVVHRATEASAYAVTSTDRGEQARVVRADPGPHPAATSFRIRSRSSTVQAINSTPAERATSASRRRDDRVVDPDRPDPHLRNLAGGDPGERRRIATSAPSIGPRAQRFEAQSLVTFG